MPYVSNKSVLKKVYCDVIVSGREFRTLSATLKEQVMLCVESHIMAFDSCTKPVDEHNKFVQDSQEFCAIQLLGV